MTVLPGLASDFEKPAIEQLAPSICKIIAKNWKDTKFYLLLNFLYVISTKLVCLQGLYLERELLEQKQPISRFRLTLLLLTSIFPNYYSRCQNKIFCFYIFVLFMTTYEFFQDALNL